MLPIANYKLIKMKKKEIIHFQCLCCSFCETPTKKSSILCKIILVDIYIYIYLYYIFIYIDLYCKDRQLIRRGKYSVNNTLSVDSLVGSRASGRNWVRTRGQTWCRAWGRVGCQTWDRLWGRIRRWVWDRAWCWIGVQTWDWIGQTWSLTWGRFFLSF